MDPLNILANLDSECLFIWREREKCSPFYQCREIKDQLSNVFGVDYGDQSWRKKGIRVTKKMNSIKNQRKPLSRQENRGGDQQIRKNLIKSSGRAWLFLDDHVVYNSLWHNIHNKDHRMNDSLCESFQGTGIDHASHINMNGSRKSRGHCDTRDPCNCSRWWWWWSYGCSRVVNPRTTATGTTTVAVVGVRLVVHCHWRWLGSRWTDQHHLLVVGDTTHDDVCCQRLWIRVRKSLFLRFLSLQVGRKRTKVKCLRVLLLFPWLCSVFDCPEAFLMMSSSLVLLAQENPIPFRKELLLFFESFFFLFMCFVTWGLDSGGKDCNTLFLLLFPVTLMQRWRWNPPAKDS